MSENNRDFKSTVLLLVFVLSLGALLRFYGLDHESLWSDELESIRRSDHENLSTVFSKGVLDDSHPPGYLIFTYFIQKYFGDSATILRFPSAVFGVLSIYIIFLVGCRLYSRREGLIASAFMAVLWTPIHFSQEARSYSMLLFFSLLSVYFLIRILKELGAENKPGFYDSVGYFTSALLCCFLHYFGLYFIALQGVYALLVFLRRRDQLTYIIMLYGLLFVAYLPWLPHMLFQIQNNPSNITWIPKPTPKLFQYFIEFAFNFSKKLFLLVMLFYALLFSRPVYSLVKRRTLMINPLSPEVLLLLWLLAPIMGAYVISLVSDTPLISILNFRNIIFSIPAAYLLLSRAITQLPLRQNIQSIIVLLFICVFLFHLFYDIDYYSRPHKEQIRDAVQHVIDENPRESTPLIIGYAVRQQHFNYYFEKLGSDLRVGVVGGKSDQIQNITRILEQNKPQYVWFVSAHYTPEEEFLDALHKNHRLVSHRKFIFAEARLYESALR